MIIHVHPGTTRNTFSDALYEGKYCPQRARPLVGTLTTEIIEVGVEEMNCDNCDGHFLRCPPSSVLVFNATSSNLALVGELSVPQGLRHIDHVYREGL